jgi:hypothetical protein
LCLGILFNENINIWIVLLQWTKKNLFKFEVHGCNREFDTNVSLKYYISKLLITTLFKHKLSADDVSMEAMGLLLKNY